MSMKARRKRRHTEPQVISDDFVATESRLAATAMRNSVLTVLASMKNDQLCVITTIKDREGLVGKKNTLP